MKRRTLLANGVRLGAVCAVGFPALARAGLACGPFDFSGTQSCEAGIESSIADVVAASVDGQHMSQWCWAACIEMVFRYYGFVVPQEEIVRQTWGSIVNLPGQPGQLLANLNRPWIDANGYAFTVSADAFSANPVTAAQDLAADMPLIIGTLGHAMVLTSLRYVRNGYGQGDVRAAVVRDPWPGQGRRVLTAQEWYSTAFLARIRVS